MEPRAKESKTKNDNILNKTNRLLKLTNSVAHTYMPSKSINLNSNKVISAISRKLCCLHNKFKLNNMMEENRRTAQCTHAHIRCATER